MSVTAVVVLMSGSLGMGILGGLLGVGGGVFLVPFMIFAANLPPKEAVAVSLCCVIGTSASASRAAAASGIARLRLALTLEPAMVVGAVVASVLATRVTDGAVLIGFAMMMTVIVVLMLVRRRAAVDADAPLSPARQGALVAAALGSGAASGLFGVGGGVLVVPALVLIGRFPLKVAATTSSLTLMTSAACGAIVYWANGLVHADMVAAAVVGVLPGGFLGARLQHRLPERVLQLLFALLAAIVVALTLYRGLTG